MFRRTTLLIGGLLSLPLAASCSTQPDALVAGTTWQVAEVWTAPDEVSTLPPNLAAEATVMVGETSVVGYTGCVPFQATVEFTADGHPSQTEDADAVTFKEVRVRDAKDTAGKVADNKNSDKASGDDQDCAVPWVTDRLTLLMKEGAHFDISRPHDREMIWTSTDTDKVVDRPAIKLVAAN